MNNPVEMILYYFVAFFFSLALVFSAEDSWNTRLATEDESNLYHERLESRENLHLIRCHGNVSSKGDEESGLLF